MKLIRRVCFGLMMVAMLAAAALVRRQGGFNGGGEAWLIPVGMVGALYAVAVVADVSRQAIRSNSQPLRYSRVRNFSASGALGIFIAAALHSSFFPER